MKEILSWLNEFLYSNILIILLVVAGMYFTLKTRFVQIRMLKEGISLLKEKAHSEDGVQFFSSLNDIYCFTGWNW